MTNDDGKVPCRTAFRLALTLGIVWGGAMLVTAAVAGYTAEYAHEMVKVFASIYFGYGPCWAGAFLGLGWGFLDVFIATLITVAIYNVLGGRRQRHRGRRYRRRLGCLLALAERRR